MNIVEIEIMWTKMFIKEDRENMHQKNMEDCLLKQSPLIMLYIWKSIIGQSTVG